MLKIHSDEGHAWRRSAPSAVLVTRRVTFAAAHVLRREEWDEERNRAVFGPCAGDHGHNYTLEITVSGVPDPDTGMVINLRDLDRIAKETIVAHVDHRHLNQVAFLRGIVPTAEQLALAFWDRLDAGLQELQQQCCLERLRLVESENNAVEVMR